MWPVFLIILLVWARKPLFGILVVIMRRIEEGAALKAGPIEVSESSPKLPVSHGPSGQCRSPDSLRLRVLRIHQ